MKKIKLLSGIAGLTALSAGLIPTIASCGCSTGLQVELVSKSKERTFNEKSNGCTYTFKLNNVSTSTNLKVKVVNLIVDGAEVNSIAGLLKTNYDSAGNIQVLINTNILSSQWPEAKTINFDLLFTDKTTGQTSTLNGFTLNYVELLKAPNFQTVAWSVIDEKLKQYYKGTITIDDFAKSFGDEDEIAYDDINKYVGLERSITIGTQAYPVRIIGVDHDILTTAEGQVTKALFTFDLKNVICDSVTKTGFASYWDSTNNYDYTASILRANLTGNGGGTPSFSNTVLSMLSTELKASLKSVKKSVATTSSYVINTYDDVLFPLTYTEMAASGNEYIKVEGTPYQYWIDNNKKSNPSENRMKKDLNGNACNYWLASPDSEDTDRATIVDSSGNVDVFYYVNRNKYVSFAFCI